MRNKGAIVFLTVIVTLLCIYYLSFTFISKNVNTKATVYATDESGNTDLAKRQAYLDSVWTEPVFNLLGMKYTYKDIKETELSLGLDLQGGMHVTLEISPVDILRGLSGNSEDPNFQAAIERADQLQRQNPGDEYASLFQRAFKEVNPDGRLAPVFAHSGNRGRISFDTSDDEIMRIIRQEIDQAVDRSFEILRTRVDRFGTSSPNIQKLQGSGRIQIELPGVENSERVRKLLQGVARLEFWQVYDLRELDASLMAINARLVEEESAKKGSTSRTDTTVDKADDDLALALQDEPTEESALADDEEDELESLLESDTSSLEDDVDSPEISQFLQMINYPAGFVSLKDTTKVNRILQRIAKGDLRTLMRQDVRFHWEVKPTKLQDDTEALALIAIKVPRGGKPALSGDVISDARQTLDERTSPAVSMEMNSEGAKKWKRLTAESIGQRVAIVLDDYVYSAPTVQVEIPNGQSIITGNFTLDEAKDLANVLKAGALPARTRIVEEAVIGSSLGKEAINQGIISIVSGLIIVVLFMIAYYSRGGLVATIALLFNIFFILGVLAQLNASLTLPGIAGIVLTIGMSIDANVLIFERIREELRNGKALLNAISLGYEKAYSSIIDANVTTFLTGVILFTFGQGPVKGFATTLMIGIACSFFTAVFITRVIIGWMTKKGDKSKISFSLPFSANLFTNLNIDFLSKRKMAYIISSSIIVLGLVLVFIEGGLNYGVDFTGGRSYIVTFNQPVVPSDLKTNLSTSFEEAGTEVKTYGSNSVMKITTSYLIDDDSDEGDATVRAALIGGIESFSGQAYSEDDSKVDESHFTISSSTKVGATIAEDIKFAAQESIFFSLIVIFLYIFVRFRKWQFGLGAVVAVFHDSLFVLAAFAIARLFGKAFEIDQVFIAAMLTIIGYSINDTVVVFDRIRENMNERP
ncbi:MAG: protein translocase subunit SecDF, partial [Cyclobacteriaceae bacterium]